MYNCSHAALHHGLHLRLSEYTPPQLSHDHGLLLRHNAQHCAVLLCTPDKVGHDLCHRPKRHVPAAPSAVRSAASVSAVQNGKGLVKTSSISQQVDKPAWMLSWTHTQQPQTAKASEHLWEANLSMGQHAAEVCPTTTPWIPTCNDQHAHLGSPTLTACPTMDWLTWCTASSNSISIRLDHAPADPTARERVCDTLSVQILTCTLGRHCHPAHASHFSQQNIALPPTQHPPSLEVGAKLPRQCNRLLAGSLNVGP